MIGGNKNGENGNDIFRFWNQLTIKNVKGMRNTQTTKQERQMCLFFRWNFQISENGFPILFNGDLFGGWKPIRRVLHFTTINVSTCKKFIDP